MYRYITFSPQAYLCASFNNLSPRSYCNLVIRVPISYKSCVITFQLTATGCTLLPILFSTCDNESYSVVYKQKLILISSRQIVSHLRSVFQPNRFYCVLIELHKFMSAIPWSVTLIYRKSVFRNVVQIHLLHKKV